MSDHNPRRLTIPTIPHDVRDDPTEHENGAAAPAAVPRRGDGRGGMIADRTPWLDLPAPWDNLEIRAWLDYPKDVADLWTKPENESPEDANDRVMMACQQIFLDHRAACLPGVDANGHEHASDPQLCRQIHEPWQDAQGALPPPQDRDFWERISTPLGAAIVTRFFEEMQGNPTHRSSRRWKRKGSRRR